MLDAVSLGRLRSYEVVIEKLIRTYPTEWGLVYAADELACSARSNTKVLMDTKAGKKNLSKLGCKEVLELCVHHDLPRRHILAYSGPCTSLDLAVGHRGQLESTGVKAITPQGSEGDSPGSQWPAQGSTSSNLRRRDVNRPGFQDPGHPLVSCLSSASAGGCSGIPSVPCTRSHVLGPLVYRLGRAGSPVRLRAGRTWHRHPDFNFAA